MRSPTLAFGVVLLAALGLLAAAAPWIAPYDPDEQLDPVAAAQRPPGTDLAAIALRRGGWLLADSVRRTPGGLEFERLGARATLAAAEVANLTPDGVADRRHYLLGTDKFGRDLLSRLLHGARVSLAVAGLAVALALTLGIAVGSLAALGGPVLDAILMRAVDALLAFPDLFLLIALAALFKPSDTLLVLVLGLISWTGLARIVRAQLLGLKKRGFVLAARGLGRSWPAIWADHLLPNALGPILVQTALLAGRMILIESALSFLGLGIQPPRSSWGNMISDGQAQLASAWWIATFPGVALSLAVISFHLVGDGLRDAGDPRLRPAARA